MVKPATISPEDVNYIKEFGLIIETWDKDSDKMAWRYLYHPKISKSIFRHRPLNRIFFELDVDDIEDQVNREDIKAFIKRSNF